jgi:hypothetical protein
MEARDLSTDRVPSFELAMRIRHPNLDPADISRELRLEPDHSFKAGDPRTSSSGIAAAAVHAESYWLCRLDPAMLPSPMGSLDDPPAARRTRARMAEERFRAMTAESIGLTLSLCATFFLRAHKDFLRRVQSEGGEVSVIVEISAPNVPGFKLLPQTSRALSDLGITLEVEFGND